MTHRIIMPDLGQTAAEGKLVRWRKKPGDRVEKGEPLFEVETDKVTMEVEAFKSGYLRELLVEEGETASALKPIAIITDDPQESYEAPDQEMLASTPAPELSMASRTPASSYPPAPVNAAPSAKSMARELGIDLGFVLGTGPGGLITRKDVEKFVGGRAAHNPMQTTADLVTRSLTIPHFYLTADVNVSAAERWRDGWNAAHPELRATFNDIFVRAASKALREVPQLNVSYQEGRYESRSAADVLLVVAAERGLALVPLADPGNQPWQDYLRTSRRILEKAKQGRVTQAASPASPLLAISNLGMFRVRQFSAIIPPSCTAILAVGTVRDEVIVLNRQVVSQRVATLTLSADHRVVDGIIAAKYMEKIQESLNAL